MHKSVLLQIVNQRLLAWCFHLDNFVAYNTDS